MTDKRVEEMNTHDLSIRMRSWLLAVAMIRPDVIVSEMPLLEEIDARLRMLEAVGKTIDEILANGENYLRQVGYDPHYSAKQIKAAMLAARKV